MFPNYKTHETLEGKNYGTGVAYRNITAITLAQHYDWTRFSLSIDVKLYENVELFNVEL